MEEEVLDKYKLEGTRRALTRDEVSHCSGEPSRELRSTNLGSG